MEPQMVSFTMRKFLLILNSTLLFISSCTGPLIVRLYFVHGGSRIWLSCSLITAGFPFTLVILTMAYIYRRMIQGPKTKIIFISRRMLFGGIMSGLIMGALNYFYAFGLAKLPVSTSSLLVATQLAFTAGFALVLVKQKFTPYSVNSVVLLTIGAGILALGASSDRPKGVSTKAYVIGFIMSLGAALLYGFVMVFNEKIFRKAKHPIAFMLVLEFQVVMNFFATAACAVGMFSSKDFQAITREAQQFELGEGGYYMLLVTTAVLWQLFNVGAVAITSYASALLSGVLVAAGLSVTELLAVLFFHEKFGGEKGVSLALSLWGFVSYFYGETKQARKNKKMKNQVATTASLLV